MGKIYLVEGFEYTGKSLLCDKLVKEYDGVYYHCPTGKMSVTSQMYDILKTPSLDEKTKLLIFLASHVENIKCINKLKHESDETVIVDRSLLSTFAYQHVTLSNFKEILRIIDMPVLDVDEVFVLTASFESVKLRAESRIEKQEVLDDYFFINMERIMNKYNDYDEIYPNGHKISTTNKTPEEVFKRVITIINRKVNNASGGYSI